MSKLSRVFALLLVAVMLVLAGCGGGSKPAEQPAATQPADQPKAEEPAPAAPEPKPELSIWIMPNSPKPDTDLLEVVQPFVDQTGIKVNVTVLDWGSAWTQITTAATSGEGPDILQLGTTWVPAIGAMDALSDVSGKVDDVGGAAAYQPASWNTTGITGQPAVFAVPWFVDARAIFYRTDAFQKASVDPAKAFSDWNSFKAALKQVNNVEIDGKQMKAIGFPGKNDWNVAHNVIPWMWGAGATELTPDLSQAAFNSNAALEGLMFYTGLAREGLVPPEVLEKNTAETEAMFANGDFAVMISGPWMIKNFKTSPEDGGNSDKLAATNYAVAPIPAGPAGRYTFFGGSNLAVFKHSKHQNEAWELVKFLSTPAAQKAYALKSGMLPAVKSVQSDADLLSDPNMASFNEAAKYGRSYPAIPAWGPMEGVLVKHFGIIWDITAGVSGTYSAAALQAELDAAAAEVNELLKQSQ